MAKSNKRFNQGMPKKGQRLTKIFNKNEITVHAKCSVHPWMGAHVGVFDHQWFSLTDANGNYQLPALPSGDYTLTFWHEVFGEYQKQITLTGEKNHQENFTFKK